MTRVRAVAIWLGLVWLTAGALAARVDPVDQPPAPAPAAPSAAPLSDERETSLRARVTQWYDARRVRDQRAMYDLLEPDYRAKTDFAAYATLTAARMRFTLVAFEIAAARATGDDQASVDVRLTMDLGRFGVSPVTSTDPWVWRDGQWWAVFKPFEPPFRKPDGGSSH
jgi:hypothetical protein